MKTVILMAWLAGCVATIWLCAYFGSREAWCFLPALATGGVACFLAVIAVSNYVVEIEK